MATLAMAGALVVGAQLGDTSSASADDWCPDCVTMSGMVDSGTLTSESTAGLAARIVDRLSRDGRGGGRFRKMGDDWCPSGC